MFARSHDTFQSRIPLYAFCLSNTYKLRWECFNPYLVEKNCLDNTQMKSFFGHLKDYVDYKLVSDLDEVCAMVDAYIDYYNTMEITKDDSGTIPKPSHISLKR